MIRERLMAFLHRQPLIDETEMAKKEEATENARLRAIETRKSAEHLTTEAKRQAGKVVTLRKSFEQANGRLGGR